MEGAEVKGLGLSVSLKVLVLIEGLRESQDREDCRHRVVYSFRLIAKLQEINIKCT